MFNENILPILRYSKVTPAHDVVTILTSVTVASFYLTSSFPCTLQPSTSSHSSGASHCLKSCTHNMSVTIRVCVSVFSSRNNTDKAPVCVERGIHEQSSQIFRPLQIQSDFRMHCTSGRWCALAYLSSNLPNNQNRVDLEWKLIFVASPGNEELDQELDDCLVGPVPQGINSFEFEGQPPDPSRIPTDDVLGVSALILTGSYKDQEFGRVGYYQNTEYDNEEMKENPPPQIMFDRLIREINKKPRVTRFHIKWCVFPYLGLHLTTNPLQGYKSTTTSADRPRRCQFCARTICRRYNGRR